MNEYLDKPGLDALWAKIKSVFVLKTTYNTHVGSMTGTIAGLQERIAAAENRLAALETGGGVTPTPTPSEYGVVNSDNHIVVNDTYTSLKYVDEGKNAIDNVTNIE